MAELGSLWRRLAQVIREMRTYNVQVLRIGEITEMRWTGAGRLESDGITILHSGGQRHERGVGILLSEEASRSLLSWEAVNDRIITARLQKKFFNTTIIQAYAPTNTADDDEKNEFYKQL